LNKNNQNAICIHDNPKDPEMTVSRGIEYIKAM